MKLKRKIKYSKNLLLNLQNKKILALLIIATAISLYYLVNWFLITSETQIKIHGHILGYENQKLKVPFLIKIYSKKHNEIQVIKESYINEIELDDSYFNIALTAPIKENSYIAVCSSLPNNTDSQDNTSDQLVQKLCQSNNNESQSFNASLLNDYKLDTPSIIDNKVQIYLIYSTPFISSINNIKQVISNLKNIEPVNIQQITSTQNLITSQIDNQLSDLNEKINLMHKQVNTLNYHYYQLENIHSRDFEKIHESQKQINEILASIRIEMLNLRKDHTIINNIDYDQIQKWNTSYLWGNHAQAGYIKSESDPLFKSSVSYSITQQDINFWNAKENNIPIGNVSQFFRGDKTWQAIPICNLNETLSWNGSAFYCVNDNTGIISINSLRHTEITFKTGTSGTNFNIVSESPSTLVFNIPSASSRARGLVTTGNQTFAGNKTFTNNIILSNTNSNNLNGILYKDKIPFLHNYANINNEGNNLFLGTYAGNFSLNGSAYHHGSRNIGIGHQTLNNLTSGYANIALGISSLTNITNSFDNIAIGNEAGTFFYSNGAYKNLTMTSSSIFIGNRASASNNNAINQIVIGHNATGHGNNTVTIGNSNIESTYLYGNVYSNGIFVPSDVKLKKDVIRIHDALSKINQINGFYFIWKDSNKNDTGLLAQEVQKVIPQAVSVQNDTSYVDYSKLIPFVIESIKELETKLNKLSQGQNIISQSLSESVQSTIKELKVAKIQISQEYIGQGTMPPHTNKLYVQNPNVNEKTHIILTPLNVIETPLAVTQIIPKQGFIVETHKKHDYPVAFKYWIIEEIQN